MGNYAQAQIQKIMKNLNFLVLTVVTVKGQEKQPRRYNQLTTLMKGYWPDYKETQFRGYGCNCLNTNDRPMSSPGKGRPVDNLDRHCAQYKQCQRCTRQFNDDLCIGEFKKYNFKKSKKEYICTDNPGTCERMICECDLQFAKGIAKPMESFDKKYHKFSGFNQDKRCNRRSGPGQLQCCRSIAGPQSLYGPSKQCCPTGQVIGLGETCDYSSYTY